MSFLIGTFIRASHDKKNTSQNQPARKAYVGMNNVHVHQIATYIIYMHTKTPCMKLITKTLESLLTRADTLVTRRSIMTIKCPAKHQSSSSTYCPRANAARDNNKGPKHHTRDHARISSSPSNHQPSQWHHMSQRCNFGRW